MPRKGENIYKRKDGRWEGRYKKGRKENGQLKYGYIYGQSYKDVKQRLYEYNLKYQTIIECYGESALSYEEWGLLWLSQQHGVIKTSTYSNYFYKLKKYVFPILGNVALNQLTSEKIQQLVNDWQTRQLETTTIHVLFQIIKKSLKDAYEQKKILHLPFQMIRLPKKKKNFAKALTKEQQRLLEAKVKNLPLYEGLPVLLALNAGLRIGEIAALRWDDIDLENKIIRVQHTFQRLPLSNQYQKTQLVFDSSKTESSNRIIPISFSLYEDLKRWKLNSPGEYVCSNSKAPCEPRLLTYYFHKIRKSCNIAPIHFHHLRHTFATRCIESNGDIASVSKLLGHTSTQTTLDIYTDSLIESRKQVIEKMDQAKSKK